MKKLILLIALLVSPVFAQEEEHEVQIEIEILNLAEPSYKQCVNTAVFTKCVKCVQNLCQVILNDGMTEQS